MAQPDSEAYGWLAALCIALVSVLVKVIGKVVKNSEDTLAIVLRRDLDALQDAFEHERKENKELHGRVESLTTEVKVLKARLGLNGQSRR
ncbi:MAG: hypothetical protein QNJ62_06590 [Methyloceanibacter sp.]|nr:hypothetical protein [Methyloceanibacter sp.]